LDPPDLARFEAEVLPHLDAAYRLARYLMRNDADADDVVQEAFLRALKYFDGFRGQGTTQSRAWVLAIVRNMAHTWRRRHRTDAAATEFDEALHSEAIIDEHPDAALQRSASRDMLAGALDHLPADFREVLVLREIEGLSYKEISEVVAVPVGTIMSRLSRARRHLQQALIASGQER
jgi:RNA polymerase sigma-70 factor (ECF subfamily)